MNVLKWIDKNFEKVLLIFLLIAMTVIMFLQVVMRYVFNNALSWAEELTRYLFVASTFFSIGYSIRHRSALRVDIVTAYTPPAVSKALNVITEGITTLFCGYFAYAAFNTVGRAMILNQKTAALRVPQAFLYALLCIGFTIGAIRGIQSLIRLIRTPAQEKEGE